MTHDEAVFIAELTVSLLHDDDCDHCLDELREKLETRFPEFQWEIVQLAGGHCRIEVSQ